MIVLLGGVALIGFGLLLALVKTETEQALARPPRPLEPLTTGERPTLKGVLEADAPVEAPLSKTPCAYWRLVFTGREEQPVVSLQLGGGTRTRRLTEELLNVEGSADGLRLAAGGRSLPLLLENVELQVETQSAITVPAIGFIPADVEELLRNYAGGVRGRVTRIVEQRLELGREVIATGTIDEVRGRPFLTTPDLAISALSAAQLAKRSRNSRLVGWLCVLLGALLAATGASSMRH